MRKNNMSGIGIFTSETMKRITASHPEHTFIYIFDEDYDKEFITSSNIKPVIVRPRGYHRSYILWFWHEIMLRIALSRIKPDLFISPDGFMSSRSKIPSIIVIHDLNFEHFPHFIPKLLAKFHRKFTPLYAKKALRVITVSEFSKQDIIKNYQIPENKIDVVFNGSKEIFKVLTEKEKQDVRSIYSNDNPYFLFVGSLHPRKNLINQLKAFELFRINNSKSFHKFLIVGEKWIWDKEHEQVLDKMMYKNEVVFTSRINDDKLALVVGAADCLLYVSKFEGFGIPILEAFSSEVPVITSNTTSMPEVGGSAVLYVNPDNDKEISEAMQLIISNVELRNSLIEKGKDRLKLFNWDNTAQLFWRSVEKAIEELKV